MSIGIVIANIAGTFRQPPAAPSGGGAPVFASAAANQDSGNRISGIQAPANQAVGNQASSKPYTVIEPTSGQSQLSAGATIVVLELLNDQGTVTATIPSAQQLAAYRAGTAALPA